MRLAVLIGLLFLSTAAFAQKVHYNYDFDTDFSKYRTYQWVEPKQSQGVSQLAGQQIMRAVDAELAQKGLQKVESGGDLQVEYQTSVDQERQWNAWSMGPRWGGGMAQATSETIDIGTIIVDMYDPAIKQLVWRGTATKTMDIKSDPDKNYRNLEKAMSKLFKNYPPKSGK